MIPKFVKKLAWSAGWRPRQELRFVTPGVNWVLDWVAHYITQEVDRKFGLPSRVTRDVGGELGQILHFGSLWDLAPNLLRPQTNHNILIGTVFHGQKDDTGFHDALETVIKYQSRLFKLHTASTIMVNRFLEWGFPQEKLVRIPLGVDLKRFSPANAGEKEVLRQKLGIPKDVFVIGSFHKDGVGHDQGFEPKRIKGPDVFLNVIEHVRKHVPVFVLLSAPARGFVKLGLDRMGVEYKHKIVNDYQDIPQLYKALDVYLMTSREEGGPQGVLEALACGIPLVATRVGLAPDVVTHSVNGLLGESEDVESLAQNILQIAASKELRTQLITDGLATIQAYDWSNIATKYFHELYEPALVERGLNKQTNE